MYRPRLLEGPLDDALADTPVVAVAGPRQAGKSTLAAHVVAARGGTWLSLDDAATLNAARTDPVGFVTGRSGLVGIDEAQRVPELLLVIKSEVDRGRRPGRFLLTGSTRLLGARRLADSLAGRMQSLTLWPFTQAELGDDPEPHGLIDRAFGGGLGGLQPPTVTRAEVLDRTARGGYLPALERTDRRRAAWYDSYVDGVIDREVRAVSDATYLRELPRPLRLSASRTSGELNVSDRSRRGSPWPATPRTAPGRRLCRRHHAVYRPGTRAPGPATMDLPHLGAVVPVARTRSSPVTAHRARTGRNDVAMMSTS